MFSSCNQNERSLQFDIQGVFSIWTVNLSSKHFLTNAVVPSSDHHCIATVAPSGEHNCTDTVAPSSDHHGTKRVAPLSDPFY